MSILTIEAIGLEDFQTLSQNQFNTLSEQIECNIFILTNSLTILHAYNELLNAGASQIVTDTIRHGLNQLDKQFNINQPVVSNEDRVFDKEPVNKDALMKRIKEISTRIIQMIRKLIAEAIHQAELVVAGITKLKINSSKITDLLRSIKGHPQQEAVEFFNNPLFWVDGEFVGSSVTNDELKLLHELKLGMELAYNQNVTKVIRLISKEPTPETLFDLTNLIHDKDEQPTKTFTLPGNVTIAVKGYSFEIVDNASANDIDYDKAIKVPTVQELRKEWANIVEVIDRLSDKEGYRYLNRIRDELTQTLEKTAKKYPDNEFIPELEKLVAEYIKDVDPNIYFKIVGRLVKGLNAKMYAYKEFIEAYQNKEKEAA